ncbi:hypothetical protein FHS43_006383 [Streptosporangium becharense]|nr:hypothetical protein [Streptosporangium becharense]
MCRRAEAPDPEAPARGPRPPYDGARGRPQERSAARTGAMTCHFASPDQVLAEAFTRHAESATRVFDEWPGAAQAPAAAAEEVGPCCTALRRPTR